MLVETARLIVDVNVLVLFRLIQFLSGCICGTIQRLCLLKSLGLQNSIVLLFVSLNDVLEAGHDVLDGTHLLPYLKAVDVLIFHFGLPVPPARLHFVPRNCIFVPKIILILNILPHLFLLLLLLLSYSLKLHHHLLLPSFGILVALGALVFLGHRHSDVFGVVLEEGGSLL